MTGPVHKRDTRMGLSTAAQQVEEDCKDLRKRLRLSSPVLTAHDLERLSQASQEIIKEKNRKYFRWEIGHRFISEHILASVKEKVGLSGTEERLLGATLGKVIYNPPLGEFRDMADAAEKLWKTGERGMEIFRAYERTVEALHKMQREVRTFHGSDIFTNPVPNLGIYLDFRDMSESKRKTEESLAKKNYKSFYK